jgi:hypothetical protein
MHRKPDEALALLLESAQLEQRNALGHTSLDAGLLAAVPWPYTRVSPCHESLKAAGDDCYGDRK